MKLEDQVVSLELSKRLKELGVKQESYFYWYPVPANRTFFFHHEVPKTGQWSLNTKNPVGVSASNMFDPEMEQKNLAFARDVEAERLSAFTVAELGEMLPKETMSWRHECGDKCDPNYFGEDEARYSCMNKTHEALRQADTEANARAKMLIYLIEEGIVNAQTS